MAQASQLTNGRQERFAKEEAIVESFRRKLRDAWTSRAIGEMNVRLTFHKGEITRKKIGMKIEYEFVDDS